MAGLKYDNVAEVFHIEGRDFAEEQKDQHLSPCWPWLE